MIISLYHYNHKCQTFFLSAQVSQNIKQTEAGCFFKVNVRLFSHSFFDIIVVGNPCYAIACVRIYSVEEAILSVFAVLTSTSTMQRKHLARRMYACTHAGYFKTAIGFKWFEHAYAVSISRCQRSRIVLPIVVALVILLSRPLGSTHSRNTRSVVATLIGRRANKSTDADSACACVHAYYYVRTRPRESNKKKWTVPSGMQFTQMH